jgi:hypothetical protein
MRLRLSFDKGGVFYTDIFPLSVILRIVHVDDTLLNRVQLQAVIA